MTVLSSDIELQPMSSDAATTQFSASLKEHTKKSNDEGDDDDDDNMTIIFLETEDGMYHNENNIIDGSTNNNNNNNLPNWSDRLDRRTGVGDTTIFDERRRIILLQELKRIQRRSFFNFVILCSLPLLLLTIMVIIVFSGTGDQECVSTISYCRLEPRTFVNAYTTRCICDPIPVERSNATQG